MIVDGDRWVCGGWQTVVQRKFVRAPGGVTQPGTPVRIVGPHAGQVERCALHACRRWEQVLQAGVWASRRRHSQRRHEHSRVREQRGARRGVHVRVMLQRVKNGDYLCYCGKSLYREIKRMFKHHRVHEDDRQA